MELTNLDISQFPSHEYLEITIAYLHQQNILTTQHVSQIKLDLAIILQERMRKFTGGDSSVSKERAQSLMDSITYTISLYLKELPLATIIELLTTKPMTSVYLQSQTFMNQLLIKTNVKIANLQCCLLSINNLVYNDTLQHGLSSFLTVYNSDYLPQDCVLTLDYPTYLTIPNKVGIALFCTYLDYQIIEHEFYNHFSKAAINSILEHYHQEYPFLIFNIAELLWRQLLLKARIGTPTLSLITTQELKQLYILLKEKTKEEIYQEIQTLYYQICPIFGVNTKPSLAYFNTGLKNIASQIYYGVKQQTLDTEISMLKK